jgi:hypothetical protein
MLISSCSSAMYMSLKWMICIVIALSLACDPMEKAGLHGQ